MFTTVSKLFFFSQPPSENRLCNLKTNLPDIFGTFLPSPGLYTQLSPSPALLLCLAPAHYCSPVFSVSSTGLSNPQAEPTPAADRILLEYKGSDLQPRGAVGLPTAAQRQEREVVHHAVCISPALAPIVLTRPLNRYEMTGGKTTSALFVTNYS